MVAAQQKRIARAMVTQVQRVNEHPTRQAEKIAELEALVDSLRRQLRQARAEVDNLSLDLDAARRGVKVPTITQVNVITTAEAARRSGCSISTINRHLNGRMKRPRFFGYQSATGRWMVYADASGAPLSAQP